ncbi:type II toxin-antitoxin system mRNA interferase toxin, RelE/StbE family [Agrobacterium sp. MA01]|nr:type II toxin-antitoxin system mRNA interferase toxin, RelE/StbE family [Agrobacterium sp. MA01]
MMLTWSALAIADRMAIFDFIEQDNPAAAIRTDTKIEAGIRQLLQLPESERTGRVSGTRELFIAGAPDIAAYSVLSD